MNDDLKGYEVYMVGGTLSDEKKYEWCDYLFWKTFKDSSRFSNLMQAKKAKKVFKLLFPRAEFCIKGF